MQPQKFGQKILIGEDELEVRAYLEMALKCLGYAVELAQDGEEVISHLKSAQADFSAVLLDLVMPRRDGMEVLREIRHIAPNLPVIIVSGAASTLNVVTAMKCGAADFLCKPLGHDELLQALNKALNSKTALDPAPPPPPAGRSKAFLGASPKMQELQALIGHVGWSEAPVLIQGETGTGKEPFAQGSLADELEVSLGSGPFPIAPRRPEHVFADNHDRVRPKPAELIPIDELCLLASPHDNRGDLSLLGVYEQMLDNAQSLRARSAHDHAARGTPERLAHVSPNRARNSSTAAPSPTRSSCTNSMVMLGTTSATPETETCAGSGM